MTLLLLLACSEPLHGPDWEGGTYLAVSGPVEGPVQDPREGSRAFAVWAWVVEDTVDAVAEEVPFRPEVGGYSLEIERPPLPTPGTLVAPTDFQLLGDAVVVVGSVVVIAGDGDFTVELEPVPVLTALVEGRSVAPYLRSDGEVVGGWTRHRLGALGSDEVQTVSALAGWTGEPCAIGSVEQGLALYAIEDDVCSWSRVEGSGEPIEVEDVPLGAL